MGTYDIEENEAHPEEVPDSLLRRQGSRKFSDRKGFPFILIAAGLVVLIIVFAWLWPEEEKQMPSPTSRPIAEPAANEANRQAIAEMESRLAEIETRMAHHQSQIMERLDQIQGKLDENENRFGKIDGRISELESTAQQFAEQLKVVSANQQSVATTKTPKTESAKTDRLYTVEKGDTLYSIARKHNISLTKLLNLNSMGKSAVIHPGDKLRVAP